MRGTAAREPGRAQAGFSLVEILIAVTVFTIALAGIMALMLTTVRANASAQSGTDALGVAERFLEEFKLRQTGWRGLLGLQAEACELYMENKQDEWSLPLSTGCASGSPWADGKAHDVEGNLAGSTEARKAIYCVHYRTKWQPSQEKPNPGVGETDEVMVTVRVAYTADGSESWKDCSVDEVNGALAAGGNARAVDIATIIRKQPPL